MISKFVRCYAILASLSLFATGQTVAGEADIIDVKVTAEPAGTFNFDVTVTHADTGWEHYADKWDVVGPDGTVYASRVLAHPHDDEQPFTRNQAGVAVPPGVKQVIIRAHDLVHGYGSKAMTADIPGR